VRPAHGTVFQVIDEAGPRVTELAARAGMTKQALTELVVHLQAAGYLERVPDSSDGRARPVRLTRRGWECIAYARAAIAGIEVEWAALIGPARLAEVKEALGELKRRARRSTPPGRGRRAPADVGVAGGRLADPGSLEIPDQTKRSPARSRTTSPPRPAAIAPAPPASAMMRAT
jgi:DNA-binding MarR family transcriptional regulator